MADLQALEQRQFTLWERDMEGPSLASVLELAGVEQYASVAVVGLSQKRQKSAQKVLSKIDIDGQPSTILDKTKSGTTKLCSPDIQWTNWIIDVSELRVSSSI